MKNKKNYIRGKKVLNFGKILSLIIFFLSLCFLTFPKAAYAYLDPGTGSLIIQVIIATLVGVSFGIKMYWRKIKTFFISRFSKRKKHEKDDY